MIHKCVNVTEGKMPLSAYAVHDTFKLYMMDTRLLCSKLDMAANGIHPYYWTSPGKAEVDFIYQDRQGNILPLEAKFAEHVRSKSLRMYCETYKPAYSLRISAKNFGFENGIKSVPLYAAFCIKP